MRFPIALLFAVSFWSVRSFKLQPDFTFAAWQRFLAPIRRLTLYTLFVGLVAGLLCTVLGFVFAYAARFKAGRFGDALMLATLITLFGGYLVKIYAWKSILGRRRPAEPGADGLGPGDRAAGLPHLQPGRRHRGARAFSPALRDPADLRVPAERPGRDHRGGARPRAPRRQTFTRVVIPQVRQGLSRPSPSASCSPPATM